MMGLDGAEWGDMGIGRTPTAARDGDTWGWEGMGWALREKKGDKKIVKNFYNRNIFSIFAVELRFLRVSQEA